MKHRILLIFSAILLILSMSACSGFPHADSYVLTTGFAKNELFKLEDQNCYLPEVLVYLSDMQNGYERIYGEEIWGTSGDDGPLYVSVKDNALALISQIKAMNILASEKGIALSEEEEADAEKAAEEYTATLTDKASGELGINKDLVLKMYREYALAHKYYREIIKDISLEISDDEARTITVEHIFIRTAETDENGNRVEYDATKRQDALRRAEEVHRLACDGEHDFSELSLIYSDGELGEFSFSKGDTDPVFEAAAFNLGSGEISDIIRTADGYHIIKCISTFNREQTDLNKLKISQEKKEQVFGEEYDSYARTLTTYFNDELWETVGDEPSEDINSQNFFEIYYKYFE